MKRDPQRMSDTLYDLVIIGGGISGAMAAWDAALRGLSVALVEKGDFGGATSAASSKLIHGGIRFLQQGLLHKVRESLVERRNFLRMIPHMINPVAFLIPTYGHFLRGKPLLSAGMAVYELLGIDRNRFEDPSRHLPGFRRLSRDEALSLEPELPTRGLTGGVVFPECHLYDSERTTLAFVASAAAHGADVANYLKVEGFLRSHDRVEGVRVRDLLSQETFEIRSRLTANVTGPWSFEVLAALDGRPRSEHVMRLSKGCHLVTRALTRGHALALATGLQNESIINRGGRHVFFIPWREHTLIGTTNVPFHGTPDGVGVTARDIEDFLVEIAQAMPAAGLRREDVVYAFGGLYPLVDTDVREDVYQGSGKYRLYDHERQDGIEGLVTAIGAKYTTARKIAEKCVDLCVRKLGKTALPCRTAESAAAGGDIPQLADFVREQIRGRPAWLGEDTIRDLVHGHGSRCGEVLALAREDSVLRAPVSPHRPTLGASVLFAVREEMALKLADVIFRRTGLGTIGHPGRDCLEQCAGLMAAELGWDGERTRQEIGEVEETFRRAT